MPDPIHRPIPRPTPAPRRRARPARIAPLGLLIALGALFPSLALAQSLGPATHAEFTLDQLDRVASVEVPFADSDPGQDGGSSLVVLGGVVGTYGFQDVSVSAMVGATTDDTLLLQAEGRHDFDLTGTDLQTDVWLDADSTMLARAQHVDELTLSGVVDTEATLELYFQIRGTIDTLIDIDPPYVDLRHTMGTDIRLEAITALPHSGGGLFSTTVDVPGSYQVADLDAHQVVDEYVMLALTVDPLTPIPLDLRFEIEPMSNLSNIVELGTLNAQGMYLSSFWDQGAELLGVVVKDSADSPVPTATLSSSQGYDIPVSMDPPLPHPPANTIVSPIAIVDSDLGEYNATVPYEQMIDQSGLSVNFVSGATGYDVYLSQPNATRSSGASTANWQSPLLTTLPAQGYIDFDLGATYTLDRMAIWNVTLENIRVQLSDDASGPWTEVGTYTLANHYNYFSYDVEELLFGAAHDARYVRIVVDSAYVTGSTTTYAIVGEVALRALPAPEPGLVAMLGSGVLVLGWLARRPSPQADLRRARRPVH